MFWTCVRNQVKRMFVQSVSVSMIRSVSVSMMRSMSVSLGKVCAINICMLYKYI